MGTKDVRVDSRGNMECATSNTESGFVSTASATKTKTAPTNCTLTSPTCQSTPLRVSRPLTLMPLNKR